eukprot:249832-Chlamydomonas_euryale.AAC.9
MALLRKLRARIPGLALRTTFISGFPGETDAAHRELVAFVKEWRWERMGAFVYSEEDGTPAAEMQEQVPPELRCVAAAGGGEGGKGYRIGAFVCSEEDGTAVVKMQEQVPPQLDTRHEG